MVADAPTVGLAAINKATGTTTVLVAVTVKDYLTASSVSAT